MTRLQKATQYSGAIFYFVAAAAIVLAVLGGYYQLQLSERLNRFAGENAAIGRLLVECTTPPEERTPPAPSPSPKDAKSSTDCYVRSRTTTGQAIQSISQISIAAAACGAANPGDVKATEDCVNKTLEDAAPVSGSR